MSSFKHTSVKNFFISIVFVSSVGFSATASAIFIDFDTKQDGTSYSGLGGSFPANEYNGVVINDSDPGPGVTFVDQLNPLNVGTSISGYYVNVGAFDSTPQTQLTLDFTTVVSDVSFDFANPSGDLTVSVFDISGGSLGVFNYVGTDLFINQAGFNYGAGNVVISGIGDIASVLIEPAINQTLVIDNLNFSPVPIPAAVWLFGSGLIGLIGIARRKKV